MVALNKSGVGAMASRAVNQRPRALAFWLFSVAALVVLMIAEGGITRVTESGLSITEWKPITGTIPPLNAEQWQAEFDAYRQIPEYQKVTGPAGMTLADYKFIYFWEWFHRVLGRIIGLAFAVPLAYFWMRKAIPAGYKAPLAGILVLGGLQGVFGWFMVRSGLSGEMTSVSHFWLSIHLLTAFLTLALLVWFGLDLLTLDRDVGARKARMTVFSASVAVVLFIQLLLGAWVAGLNAGLASDTWPLMQGRIFPQINFSQGIGWTFTHEPFLLHFMHRWWAFVALAALIGLARRVKRAGHPGAAVAINVVVGTQVVLGIATVLTGVALWLAVLHQLVGAFLVGVTAWGAHELGKHS